MIVRALVLSRSAQARVCPPPPRIVAVGETRGGAHGNVQRANVDSGESDAVTS